MKLRPPFQWPPDKERERRKAIRLEWITLAGMGSVVLVVYFALGNSQAMRTAWIEDIVGLVPAIIYLVAAHVERREPSAGFPFGFYRSFSIAYLFGATATLFVGLYLLAESAAKLIMQEHPTIGLMSVFGYDVWAGWLMIAALLYSIIPPMILGRLKMPVAHRIHDKVLMADAAMQKADWLADLAAIAGIIGIGFGLWWADAVAAAVISIDIAYDGGRHVLRAMRDLLDQTPRTLDRADPYPGIGKIRDAVLALDWVEQAKVEAARGRPSADRDDLCDAALRRRCHRAAGRRPPRGASGRLAGLRAGRGARTRRRNLAVEWDATDSPNG